MVRPLLTGRRTAEPDPRRLVCGGALTVVAALDEGRITSVRASNQARAALGDGGDCRVELSTHKRRQDRRVDHT